MTLPATDMVFLDANETKTSQNLFELLNICHNGTLNRWVILATVDISRVCLPSYLAISAEVVGGPLPPDLFIGGKFLSFFTEELLVSKTAE